MDDREGLLDSAPLPLVRIEVGIVEGSAEEETVVEACEVVSCRADERAAEREATLDTTEGRLVEQVEDEVGR